MAKISSKQAVSFPKDIVFRFGVPNAIITDNDTQFTGKKFLNFCDDNNIWVDWAAVAHPYTNGLVERANGMILQGLKSRILTQEGRDIFAQHKIRAGKWATEVPSVL
jgi:transposase InsO family protein